MLRRWQLPLWSGESIEVAPEHWHAAATWLLDPVDRAHRANDKPYSVRPPIEIDGIPCLEVVTFTDPAADIFVRSTQSQPTVQLGSATIPHGGAHLAETTTFDELRSRSGDLAWLMQMRSPCVVRRGSRAFPLVEPGAILAGLARRWQVWSGTPLDALRHGAVYATALEVVSQTMQWESQRDTRRTIWVSGAVGWQRVEADGALEAEVADALLRWGEWAGIGAYTARGFGAISLEPTHQPRRPGRGSRTGTADQRSVRR